MNRHRLVRASVVLTLVQALFVLGAAPASATVIEESGQTPLTRIETTPDLNCAVNHAGDTVGSFFSDTACGTLLATGGTLFGPAVIPFGNAAGPRTGFTPVSQTGVTGTGTATDPWRIVTVVDSRRERRADRLKRTPTSTAKSPIAPMSTFRTPVSTR